MHLLVRVTGQTSIATLVTLVPGMSSIHMTEFQDNSLIHGMEWNV